MKIRVLATVKEGGKLLGFDIVSSKSIEGLSEKADGKSVYTVDLRQAQSLYAKVPFENVSLEKGKWSGKECSIDRMPEMDVHGQYVKGGGDIYVLNRLTENGRTKGYTVMFLGGGTKRVGKRELVGNLDMRGVVNGKVVKVKSGKDYYISGIRQEIPTVEIEKTKKDNMVEKKEPEKRGDGKNMKLKRMRELVPVLREAAYEYYQNSNEIMSNYEYDKLYNELETLEKETGVVLSGSVTQQVGYMVQSKLPKVKHSEKMMSLDKTKDRGEIGKTLLGKDGFLSWKLDGITLVATYENGELVSAVTRGDGTTGEDVTNNYKVFSNVPSRIAYKGKLVLRGEGVISYATFDRINGKIKSEADKYKNPRNLAAGSIRQLETKKTAERDVEFVVFTVVEGFEDESMYTGKLEKAKALGFSVVEYLKVNEGNMEKAIEAFEKRIEKNPYPTDGLVLSIDDIEYGKRLGATSKFPKNAKAFKWADEVAETELLEIHWSPSRTGAINPVAVFKPVELEGTTVQRASLHNISVMEELLGKHPYRGQKVRVIKSNMIIPQIIDSDKEEE